MTFYIQIIGLIFNLYFVFLLTYSNANSNSKLINSQNTPLNSVLTRTFSKIGTIYNLSQNPLKFKLLNKIVIL